MRSFCASGGRIIKRQPLVTVVHRQHRNFKAAVVGGGITGLTAAWKLTHDPRCSEITVYEKSPHLGGWMNSEVIPVDDGHVVFEYGPRTLRSAASAVPTLWMALQLGLENDLIWSPKISDAALNRFLYYPDRLVRVPTPQRGVSRIGNLTNALNTLWKEPVFETLLPAIILESFKPARHPDLWSKDESVAEFISRRFTPEVAENLVSAFMHGIYAGDIDKLSAQALLGPLRNMDDTGIISGTLNDVMTRKQKGVMDHALLNYCLQDSRIPPPRKLSKHQVDYLNRLIKLATTFTFKRGTQHLVDGLADALRKSPKVKVLTNSEVKNMSRLSSSDGIYVTSHDGNRGTYDRVIASFPTPALAKALGSTNHPGQTLPHKTISKLKQHDYAVTVMVVNLYYPNLKKEDFKGFGYLIPRSVPVEQNPECGLGVLFSSASSSGLPFSPDDPFNPTELYQDTAKGVKLTVMFGGHYWDDWKQSDYPDHDTSVKMARDLLKRHIGITDAPTVTRANLQQNAIPQYTVGHVDRMYDLSKTVQEEFNKRLVLAGNWYSGVSVNDCVRQGLFAATYGVGRRTLDQDPHLSGAWRDYNFWDWDLEGGIPTAPIAFYGS
ncbi:hypothetical protein N7478_007810 [Penicillium angulare]|uniref:uncharacterized protein n=1 Tax=Penicillium angulare TaxID=116970 RepID=UPI002541AA57|nr:uncharacterized protein N7478_007810 [Penicillium angulare]KAJ5272685.1 hypothetical protein N7478_007810 [Penicillium angulare]